MAEEKADPTFPPDMVLKPYDPAVHCPFVGLVNPKSGGKKGKPILEVCRRSPVYKDNMFHIIEVVINKGKDANDASSKGELDNFRAALLKAKDESVAKNDPLFRPRIICGGGDGTASFALMIVFKALLSNPDPAKGLPDAGNGFIWSDDEMQRYFPALVQMPLGTGNDLGGVLGWGRKYPGHTKSCCCQQGSHAAGLRRWFDKALLAKTTVINFDVWGFMPPPGEENMDLKVCELAAVKKYDGKKHLVMKAPDVVVPFLSLLYSSFGFSANVVAEFQVKRHESQLANLLEYVKIGRGLICGKAPAELRKGMQGMSITNAQDQPAEKNGTDQYFPPRKTRSDKQYGEVGFININSYSGGAFKGADRARCARRWFACGMGRQVAMPGDGMADFYRERGSILKSWGKTGTLLQTDKKPGGTFKFEAAQGQGVFMQYDGEGRFVFHPDGKEWRMDIQLVMKIPMVVNTRVPSVSTDPVAFTLPGDPEQVARIKHRIGRWVHGQLAEELNASEDDIRKAGLPLERDLAGASA